MTQKRIYILNGHPAESSLSRVFAETYAQAAQAAGHEIRLTHLRDLDFDCDYGYGGYTHFKPLEGDLEKVLDDLVWCEHWVLMSPMWWGGLPAKLKGLIDRAFLPGRTFDTRSAKGGFPRPMLTGRSARVILTADTPKLFLRLLYKNAILWQLKGQIFEFVGFKPARATYFSGASHPKDGDVDRWIETVRSLATKAG